jgi:hypothetical protein
MVFEDNKKGVLFLSFAERLFHQPDPLKESLTFQAD